MDAFITWLQATSLSQAIVVQHLGVAGVRDAALHRTRAHHRHRRLLRPASHGILPPHSGERGARTDAVRASPASALNL